MLTLLGSLGEFLSPLSALCNIISKNKDLLLKILLRCFRFKIISLSIQYILLPLVISINPCSIFTNLAVIYSDNFTIFIILTVLSANTLSLNKLGLLYYPIFNKTTSTQQVSVNFISLSLGYLFWNSVFSTNYVQDIINDVLASVSYVQNLKVNSYGLADSGICGYFVLMENWGSSGPYDFGKGPSNQGFPSPNPGPNQNDLVPNTQEQSSNEEDFEPSYPIQPHNLYPKSLEIDLVYYTKTNVKGLYKPSLEVPLAYEQLRSPVLHRLTNNHQVVTKLGLIKSNPFLSNVKGNNLYRSYSQASLGDFRVGSKNLKGCIKFKYVLNPHQAYLLEKAHRNSNISSYGWRTARIKLYANPTYPDVINIFSANIQNKKLWAIYDGSDILCKKLEIVVKTGSDWVNYNLYSDPSVKQVESTGHFVLVCDRDDNFLNKKSRFPKSLRDEFPQSEKSGFRIPLGHDTLTRMRSRALIINVNNRQASLFKPGSDGFQYIWVPRGREVLGELKSLTDTQIRYR